MTRAVATQLYRLMAIKDEYEVARLHSSETFQRQIRSQFSGNYRLSFHLAPPVLSRPDPVTGVARKREFGPWVLPLFHALAKLKFLRGTALDPFAWSKERREEQADLKDYLLLLDALTAGLNAGNYQTAVELAALPSQLRGFGHIRKKNREALREQRAHLLDRFNGKSPNVIDAVKVA